MDLQKIKEKVDEIASVKKIHAQEIYNRILSYLETTYNYTIPSGDEKKIIEEIKNRLLTGLYSMDRHRMTVNHATKYNQVFDLDEIEMKLLDKALQELQTEGQVSSLMYEISLTDKGVMTARNL